MRRGARISAPLVTSSAIDVQPPLFFVAAPVVSRFVVSGGVFVESIRWLVSIGGIAGARVEVSVAGVSALEQATASTAMTRAKRFMTFSEKGLQ
jgi:hypothetical protein